MNKDTRPDYSSFEEFFCKATGSEPYPYQKRLSEGDLPDIVNAPTGSGKTESAVLSMWLWRRMHSNETIRDNTPRRLIYCLPMRTLVEQTVSKTAKWLDNLGLEKKVRLTTLMGGSADEEYRTRPEQDMIIVGTQDMLLSRALNRGYAMSVFAWTQEFGLVNNDCMWIMDEIQLMHNGLATSVQMDAFRKAWKTCGPHKTVWMSATANTSWLKTVDRRSEPSVLEWDEKKDGSGEIGKRINASKQLHVMDFKKTGSSYTKKEAKEIMSKHKDGTTTLVIVNTVSRAQSIYREMSKIQSSGDRRPEITLLHSRFRKMDRDEKAKKIADLPRGNTNSGTVQGTGKRDLIIVATQVVEAGVDVSSATLITEMAPWPSLVQRFGRCNRYGETDDADIHVITLKSGNKSPKYPPYEDADVERSAKIVNKNKGTAISAVSVQVEKMPDITHEHVVRKPHIADLFDTTPDAHGSYTDISRYVRSIENTHDVNVFWREWKNDKQVPRMIEDGDSCSVPVWDIKDSKKKKRSTYLYDHVQGEWNKISQGDIKPGQTILLRCNEGGYSKEEGWSPESSTYVEPISDKQKGSDRMGQDPADHKMITLEDHTANVVGEMERILSKIRHIDKSLKSALSDAAALHDIGKAHELFQNRIAKPPGHKDTIYAKYGGSSSSRGPFFRHEAASSLAILEVNGDKNPACNLVAYIIATHHGKVGMAMRPVHPARLGKEPVSSKDSILGISADKQDEFMVICKPRGAGEETGVDMPCQETVRIRADRARIGSADGKKSWLRIVQELLNEHGPFQLAYLESVMRAADQIASKGERA